MELYRNEIGTVLVNVPAGASTFTATMTKDGVPTSIADINYNATDSIVSVGLPFSATSLDQEFDVTVNFTIGAEMASITERVKVVTALVSRQKANQLAPGRFEEVEPVVRHIIEAYTGQYFGKWQGIFPVYGEDDTELQLPHRLISLTSVAYNGVTRFADSYLIKGERWFLARNRRTYSDSGVVSVNPIEYPFYSRGFREHVEYAISGVWGYESVPIPVSKAAEILFKDYVCNEATYRERYVSDVAAQDWKIKFSNRTWDGTGNVLADQLLEQYRRSGMAII